MRYKIEPGNQKIECASIYVMKIYIEKSTYLPIFALGWARSAKSFYLLENLAHLDKYTSKIIQSDKIINQQLMYFINFYYF